jgi:hypothetical protein
MWDSIKNFFLYIYESIILGVSDLFSLIPAPDFLENINSSLSIPSSVAFFAAPMQFQFGVGVIVSAYTIRFLIRRIPIIG